MNNEFFEALSALGSENSVDQTPLLESISAAMLKAAQKAYPYAEDDDIRVEIDPATQRFDIYMKKSVVEGKPKTDYEVSLEEARLRDPDCELGDLVECLLDPVRFGRSIALFAKQSIRGDLRAINRKQMLDKFEDKEHQIITVKVTQVDPARGTVTVEYDHTELYLSRNEQLFTEQIVDGKPVRIYETLKEGQLIKVYVTNIQNRDKKPIVRISRVDRGFVECLLRQAIPEIEDGSVVIEAVSREAGYRSKIAVSSTVPGLDPVGTCLGPQSSRLAPVLKELHGEKIDIVEYSEDPAVFITNALAPATVLEVIIKEGDVKAAKVLVPKTQLSLAIGAKGQTAKLAAKLTGYKIDIKDPEQDALDAAAEEEAAVADADFDPDSSDAE